MSRPVSLPVSPRPSSVTASSFRLGSVRPATASSSNTETADLSAFLRNTGPSEPPPKPISLTKVKAKSSFFSRRKTGSLGKNSIFPPSPPVPPLALPPGMTQKTLQNGQTVVMITSPPRLSIPSHFSQIDSLFIEKGDPPTPADQLGEGSTSSLYSEKHSSVTLLTPDHQPSSLPSSYTSKGSSLTVEEQANPSEPEHITPQDVPAPDSDVEDPASNTTTSVSSPDSSSLPGCTPDIAPSVSSLSQASASPPIHYNGLAFPRPPSTPSPSRRLSNAESTNSSPIHASNRCDFRRKRLDLRVEPGNKHNEEVGNALGMDLMSLAHREESCETIAAPAYPSAAEEDSYFGTPSTTAFSSHPSISSYSTGITRPSPSHPPPLPLPAAPHEETLPLSLYSHALSVQRSKFDDMSGMYLQMYTRTCAERAVLESRVYELERALNDMRLRYEVERATVQRLERQSEAKDREVQGLKYLLKNMSPSARTEHVDALNESRATLKRSNTYPRSSSAAKDGEVVFETTTPMTGFSHSGSATRPLRVPMRPKLQSSLSHSLLYSSRASLDGNAPRQLILPDRVLSKPQLPFPPVRQRFLHCAKGNIADKRSDVDGLPSSMKPSNMDEVLLKLSVMEEENRSAIQADDPESFQSSQLRSEKRRSLQVEGAPSERSSSFLPHSLGRTSLRREMTANHQKTLSIPSLPRRTLPGRRPHTGGDRSDVLARETLKPRNRSNSTGNTTSVERISL